MAKKIRNLGHMFSMRMEDDNYGIISTNGGVYIVNNITIKIIEKLDKKENSKLIIYDLLREYDVEYSKLYNDFKNILMQLYKFKFLSYDVYIKKIEELE